MKKSTQTRLGRAIAMGLSAAMVSALALLGAAPAAAVPGSFTVSGVVNTPDGAGFAPLAGVLASITVPDPGYSDTVYSALTGVDGAFVLEELGPGTYTVMFELEGYEPESVDVEIVDADVALASPVTMAPTPAELAAGTVAITGTPVVGSVMTAETAGWPVGATLSYQWIYSCGECGGPVDGEVAATYTVTNEVVGYRLGVIVTGTMAGYSDTTVRTILDTVTSAPKKAPAPAPTDLSAYLQANGSTPQAQTSTGLPAGALNPGTAQTASVAWSSPDSYVDVYVFSTPTFIGTFPVVNGVVKVTLSPALLSQLAAGSHTMVITGQTSGAVHSVALSVGLPVTGVDVTLPLTLASLFVLLGAGLMFIRYRSGVRA